MSIYICIQTYICVNVYMCEESELESGTQKVTASVPSAVDMKKGLGRHYIPESTSSAVCAPKARLSGNKAPVPISRSSWVFPLSFFISLCFFFHFLNLLCLGQFSHSDFLFFGEG